MLQCFVNQNAHVYKKTVNMVVFFVKRNENTYSKGRALMQIYRVVPIRKRGNSHAQVFCVVNAYISFLEIIKRLIKAYLSVYKAFL